MNNQKVKDKLDKFADGKYMNDAVKLLLEDVKIVENPVKCNKKYKNIHISEDV